MPFKKIFTNLLNSTKLQTPAEKKLDKSLAVSIIIMLLLNLIRLYDFIINPNNQGLPLGATLSLLIFFIILQILLRRGHKNLSAWLLIAAYTLPTIFCLGYWGADLPAALLMTVLIIMLAGIFLNARVALAIALIFSAAIIGLNWLQTKQIIAVNHDWRQQPMQLADALSYVIILGLIFGLAWMIVKENRQTFLSLKNKQEELNKINEELEIKVAERTRAIKMMQREKLEQLQALASIGQLSSSIFHDIINPLTIVSLNLEQIDTKNEGEIEKSNVYIQQALSATARINDLISSANRCLRRQSRKKYFSVRQEIEKIQKIMEGKARASQTTIRLEAKRDYHIKGGPVRFGQIFMNLLSNAIDACAQNKTTAGIIKITIDGQIDGNKLLISIKDNGIGIPSNHLHKIFDIFFTTKPEDSKNVGLGLSIVKEIIENDFYGTIAVESQPGQGSTFTVSLPL
ncbi:MAG: HAMP domain-containing sensor histidine kinase [Patescibacteria group bacterium]|nr:HAMP domain-containing sensor histidine kinase [Patescibacteria group bacterium]